MRGCLGCVTCGWEAGVFEGRRCGCEVRLCKLGVWEESVLFSLYIFRDAPVFAQT